MNRIRALSLLLLLLTAAHGTGVHPPCHWAVHHATVARNRYPAISRPLEMYRKFLGDRIGKELDACLKKLGPEDHWLDSGAGNAVAQRRSGLLGKVRMTALVYTRPNLREPKTAEELADPQMVKDYQEAKALAALLSTDEGRHQLRYLEGKLLEETPASEMGKTRLITDIIGPGAYSPVRPDIKLSTTFRRYGEYLEPGGDLFMVIPGLTLDMRIGGPHGQGIELKRFFARHCRGFDVVSCETAPYFPRFIQIHLRRNADPLFIPEIEMERMVPSENGPAFRQVYFVPEQQRRAKPQ